MTAAHSPAGTAAARRSSRDVLARLDRIDTWSLPSLFIGVIGLGFLFTFYDIFDINVSFIQTCVALKPGCSPATALDALKTPVVLNLAGYVVGTLALSPLADRVGRRNMLMVTMAVTGLGSLYNALAPDYTNFVIARVITGIGIGADLAIVNTFIGEVAPRRSRAKFTSLIFVMSALGALLGIWLGLILTTEAAPWPKGLSFAQAGPGFDNGWRWMYAVGAVLALIAILLRIELPESPRWLVGRGRVEEADAVVADMERVAARHGALAEPRFAREADREVDTAHGHMPYRTVLGNPMYLRRVLLLVVVWLTGYVTVYGFSAGFTSVLTAQGYAPPEAGVIVAVGAFGFLLCAVAAVLWSERLNRKVWLPISAAVTLAGCVIIAAAGDTLGIAFAGSAIIFFGFNLWVPMTYARSAECFPTRARTTGFALVDGVGHLGGGIGVLLIAPAVPHLSILGSLLLITAGLVIAAVVGSFGIETRNRRFEEVSP
ncbi:MAG TPA: MFS transporter [Gaiellales bacterium]|nr:MFS transporter [Gaiellales bacterium]